MRKLILALPLLALASCGAKSGTTALVTQPSVPSAVGLIQADYPTVKAAALVYAASPGANASTVATINAAITAADPIVAGLNSTSPTASVLAGLQALSTLVLTPAGQASTVSANTKADISNALALLTTAAQIATTLAPIL